MAEGRLRKDTMEPFRVSSSSNPNATAGAVANVVRVQGFAELQVIGAGALNQAMKAVAIARSFLLEEGVDLVCAPSFTDVEIEGEIRTAIRLSVDDRHRTPGMTISQRTAEERAPQDRD